jgi:hypothetical protein
MALVMKTNMVENHLSTKMLIKDGVTTNISIDGITHIDVITYPSQENFEDGAILGLIQKPFIDFAKSCGGAGDMTAEMITNKYGDQIPESLVNTIVEDFSKAYGNYVIIPEGMTLAITALPVKSIFELMIPDEPVKENEEITE